MLPSQVIYDYIPSNTRFTKYVFTNDNKKKMKCETQTFYLVRANIGVKSQRKNIILESFDIMCGYEFDHNE